MLPSGFKKDSRIWLHKNPKPRGDDVDKTAVLQRFLNSEREEEEGYNHALESNGRQFKKDSRTWLHKSSQKKTQLQRRKGANPVAGDYCREAVSPKMLVTLLACTLATSCLPLSVYRHSKAIY